MDLTKWVAAEVDGLRRRVDEQVLQLVPPERRRERPGGGPSIVAALWHTGRHADLALHAVLLGEAPLLDEWRDDLDAVNLPAGSGLGEAEDPADTAQVDATAVGDYLMAVLDAVITSLGRLDLASADAAVDGTRALRASGVPDDEFGWLFGLWSERPRWWFLQWEVISHTTGHLGEMIATRDRMGLNPFQVPDRPPP